jgi:hypothetical protein
VTDRVGPPNLVASSAALENRVSAYARYRMRSLFLAVAFVLASLGVAVTAPLTARAHFGGGAFILVPADHVNPGETFNVIAADLTPNARVSLTIALDATSVSLGEATSDAEGHFQTTIPLPSDFPSGYAQLTAVAEDGTQASTWVLVGPRTAATPRPPGSPEWWQDPSVIVLGIAVIGGVGALLYALVRRQSQRVPVAPGSARRRSTGKAQRRASRRGQA